MEVMMGENALACFGMVVLLVRDDKSVVSI